MSDRTSSLVNYAADMVLFAAMEEDSASVLLIRRGKAPFAGMWALPGGRVDATRETGMEAAIRETEEETGIAIDPGGGEVLPVGAYDTPRRDPRGPAVSAAFTATLAASVSPVAGDDASHAEWVELRLLDLDALAFDHGRIIRDALELNGLTMGDFR